MSASDYLPASGAKLLAWVQNLYNFGQENYGGWQVPSPASFLKKPFAAFQKSFEAASKPNRGKLDVSAKNAAKKTLTDAVRGYVRTYLRYNPAVTDADRQVLGLRPLLRGKIAPVPAPASRPSLVLSNRDIRQVRIDYHDLGSKRRGKPEGARGIEIRYALLESPPAAAEHILNSETDTHSPHVLNFENSQRGKTVYIAARWESFTGKKGPWSEVYNTIVP